MGRSKNDDMRFTKGGKVHKTTSRTHGKIKSTAFASVPVVVVDPFSENFEKHHIAKSNPNHSTHQKRQSATDKASDMDDKRSVTRNSMLHMSKEEYANAKKQLKSNLPQQHFVARGRFTRTTYDNSTIPPTMHLEGPTKGSFKVVGKDHRSKKEKKATVGTRLDHLDDIIRITPLTKSRRSDGTISSDSD